MEPLTSVRIFLPMSVLADLLNNWFTLSSRNSCTSREDSRPETHRSTQRGGSWGGTQVTWDTDFVKDPDDSGSGSVYLTGLVVFT